MDPDGNAIEFLIPVVVGFVFLLKSDSQQVTAKGLPYEPDRWNLNLEIKQRTNCYAYAMNLQSNPINGTPFPKKGEGGFALQPGDLFGSKLKNLKSSTIEALVSLDCRKIGYIFKETTFEKKIKKGNWKVALVIRSNYPGKVDDYHWYRQNEDGTWSHKPGNKDVTNLDDAENIILDPREAKSTYEFIKFYEVGPND